MAHITFDETQTGFSGKALPVLSEDILTGLLVGAAALVALVPILIMSVAPQATNIFSECYGAGCLN